MTLKIYLRSRGIKIEADLDSIQNFTERALEDLNNVWLTNTQFVAGDEFSIADMVCYCQIK